MLLVLGKVNVARVLACTKIHFRADDLQTVKRFLMLETTSRQEG